MRFKSIAEFLALTGDDAPTTAERDLIAATKAGRDCYLCDRKNPSRPTAATDATRIRASLLRLLITGGSKDCNLHDRGVTLIGGWIKGTLNLAYCSARGQTVLRHSHFAEKPRFEAARFHLLSLRNSAFPNGLFAQSVRVKGSLFLTDISASCTVDVNAANIGEQLNFEGATLDGGKDAEDAQIMALSAQRMKVTASFLFRSVGQVTGRIDLTAAQVGDLVDDAKSWPIGPDQLLLDGFTYDRLAGTAPTTLAARRKWLCAGSHWQGEFRPQPYTQLARVLRQMGHAGEARKVLMERTCLQAKTTRASRKVVPNGDVSVGFRSLWADVRNLGHWIGDRFAFWVAGYGHAPLRSLWCLIVLFGLGTFLAHVTWKEGSFAPNSAVILDSSGWATATAIDCHPVNPGVCDWNPANTWANTFTANADTPTQGADWDSFNRYGYAADLVIPFLDLGQTDAWAPSKDRGDWGWWLWWLRWVLAAAGWIVTGLGVAAVTGVMQRNQPD
jgi:hypothetical protein